MNCSREVNGVAGSLGVRVRHSRDEVLGDVGACAYLLLEEMWAVVEAATPM